MPVCDCMLMYVLNVSAPVYCPTYCGRCVMRDRMLTQWPAPDLMAQSIQGRCTLKYTLVPPQKCFNKY